MLIQIYSKFLINPPFPPKNCNSQQYFVSYKLKTLDHSWLFFIRTIKSTFPSQKQKKSKKLPKKKERTNPNDRGTIWKSFVSNLNYNRDQPSFSINSHLSKNCTHNKVIKRNKKLNKLKKRETETEFQINCNQKKNFCVFVIAKGTMTWLDNDCRQWAVSCCGRFLGSKMLTLIVLPLFLLLPSILLWLFWHTNWLDCWKFE